MIGFLAEYGGRDVESHIDTVFKCHLKKADKILQNCLNLFTILQVSAPEKETFDFDLL